MLNSKEETNIDMKRSVFMRQHRRFIYIYIEKR